MGWFNKKDKKDEKKNIPSLPELPKLPELPQDKIKNLEPLHQLPSFPNDSLGERFSQNTIKEAINGKKEDKSAFEIDDIEEPEEEMFQGHSKKITEEIPSLEKIPREFKEAAKKVKEAEPIFIRIDKFEESLQIFKKIKKQISEIEKMLTDIKQIKEEEEKELETWEENIKIAKNQIEKIDKDIFSKIE
jgi:hypothetical protein